ncbi:hypothetical protein C8A01DRAFT_18657 [Parachaetomium inaequale]|uniref:Uncharacterized protein n=1 Tax=Parachaetomium inaequale TaxID=2588326 RepID=A0AAN6PA30_9PEZI|nr:hypothetical protein C8A01DRAFT_18657 [Parachaetomium inaequale]
MELAGPGFASLPPELLATICTFLCSHCEREHNGQPWPFEADPDHQNYGSAQAGVQTPAQRLGSRSDSANLSSLSRVCRSLHAAAEPFLYHCPATSGQSDLWLLAKTLINRPDLASRVLELDLGYPTLDASILLTAMLLHLAPSLQRAHFCLPSDSAFNTLLAELAWSCPPLLSLKALAFSVLDTIFRPTKLSGAAPILRLAPHLRALHLDSCSSVTKHLGVFLGRDANTQPPSLHITELSLSHASLDFESLRFLLRETGPRLSRVSIRRTGTLRARGDWGHRLEFNDVLNNLNGSQQTLKNLSFTSSKEVLFTPARPRLDISTLHNFQALEILRTDAVFFTSHGETKPDNNPFTATIPSSLQELHLGGYYVNLGPDLRVLLAAFQVGHYAALRKIEIDAGVAEEYDPESEAAQQLREVAASFRSAGVDFVVHGDEHQHP